MRPLKNKEETSYIDDILNKIDSVASATECTGLMYRPPETEAEAESYTDIYVVPKAENSKEKELR